MMLCKYIAFLLQSCFALLVSSSIIKRYQDYPLPICPVNAVCSEIIAAPSQRLATTFYSHVTCKCPGTTFCPDKPGEQTFSVDSDKWYGLCQPFADIPRCAPGQIAAQIVVDAPEYGGRTYNKVQCRCAGELLEVPTDDAWSEPSTNTGATYDFICNDNTGMSKRGGRFGNNGRNRGRFYFYKK